MTDFIPNDTDKLIAKKLRVRRSLLGISVEKLADEIQLTANDIFEFENIERRIPAATLYEVACVLGVYLDYFFKELNIKSLKS